MGMSDLFRRLERITRYDNYSFYKSIVIKSMTLGDFVMIIYHSKQENRFLYKYWNEKYYEISPIYAKNPRYAINDMKDYIKQFEKEEENEDKR